MTTERELTVTVAANDPGLEATFGEVTEWFFDGATDAPEALESSRRGVPGRSTRAPYSACWSIAVSAARADGYGRNASPPLVARSSAPTSAGRWAGLPTSPTAI